MPPNWGKLLEENRCKALGVPWTEAELNAIYQLKIPVEYVRNGCLTAVAYELAHKGGTELRYKSKTELQTVAKSLGITYGLETTRSELIDLIKQSQTQ